MEIKSDEESALPSEYLELGNRAVNVIDALIAYWGSDLKCRFANNAYQQWFGKSPSEMLGIPLDRLLGPLYEPSFPHIQGALNGESQVFERVITQPDGKIRHGLVSFHPDVADGRVQGFSVYVVDHSRVKQLEFNLEKCEKRAELLASHDFLTGLPSRFLLTDRISALLAQAENRQEIVGIVLIDIEGMKEINAIHGFDVGDGVIPEVARRLKHAISSDETVVRTGGDDFLLLILGARTVTEVNLAINRLLRVVQQPLQYGRASLTPKLSFGIAIYPLNGTNASELLVAAEKTLRSWSSLGESPDRQ